MAEQTDASWKALGKLEVQKDITFYLCHASFFDFDTSWVTSGQSTKSSEPLWVLEQDRTC